MADRGIYGGVSWPLLQGPAYRHAVEARAARGQVEAALEAAGWPWSARLSAWIDVLVVLEESGPV
jgi:hypothetical protein